MDGYSLTAKLRKARRKFRLSATSQALFYELVAIANEDGWPMTFQCSNAELESALNISDKTLITARKELIDAKLIEYSSGKGRKAFNIYSIIFKKNDGEKGGNIPSFNSKVEVLTRLNGVENDGYFPPIKEKDAVNGVENDGEKGGNIPDYNKHKNKTKNIKGVISSPPDFDFLFSAFKKKSEALEDWSDDRCREKAKKFAEVYKGNFEKIDVEHVIEQWVKTEFVARPKTANSKKTSTGKLMPAKPIKTFEALLTSDELQEYWSHLRSLGFTATRDRLGNVTGWEQNAAAAEQT